MSVIEEVLELVVLVFASKHAVEDVIEEVDARTGADVTEVCAEVEATSQQYQEAETSTHH